MLVLPQELLSEDERIQNMITDEALEAEMFILRLLWSAKHTTFMTSLILKLVKVQ